MSGWAAAGFAGAALAGWVGVVMWRDRRGQRAWAARAPMTWAGFVGQMVSAGVEAAVAEWLCPEIGAYHWRPLTPFASDRVYSDFRIDPDDIRDLARRYERAFGARPADDAMPVPADPTWAELCLALRQARSTPDDSR